MMSFLAGLAIGGLGWLAGRRLGRMGKKRGA